MTATLICHHDAMSVYDYRCTAGPGSKPFAEHHTRHSLA
jgi:AraC family transcriptional regulator